MKVLEVFADVWCPFTHVGLRRFVDQRARRRRDDVVVRVRSWPLELVNGKPLSSALVSEEIRALRDSVAPDLFGGFDADHFPATTLPALELVTSVYRRDDRTGEQVSLLLRTALFEEGRDIADPNELEAIAQSVGLSRGSSESDRVRDDWQEGRERGVIGSPHFFVAGHGFYCPTLTSKRVDGRLRITADPDGFDAFVAAVFE